MQTRDLLTGLHSHQALDAWRGRRRLRPRATAIIYLNIDRLAHVNHDHGYLVGEEVLRWIAALVAARPGLRTSLCA